MTPTHLLGALLFVTALVASVPHSAKAEIYRPWCAQYYGANGGGTNCGFTSYQQCMMTAQGAVDVLYPNVMVAVTLAEPTGLAS